MPALTGSQLGIPVQKLNIRVFFKIKATYYRNNVKKDSFGLGLLGSFKWVFLRILGGPGLKAFEVAGRSTPFRICGHSADRVLRASSGERAAPPSFGKPQQLAGAFGGGRRSLQKGTSYWGGFCTQRKATKNEKTHKNTA